MLLLLSIIFYTVCHALFCVNIKAIVIKELSIIRRSIAIETGKFIIPLKGCNKHRISTMLYVQRVVFILFDCDFNIE